MSNVTPLRADPAPPVRSLITKKSKRLRTLLLTVAVPTVTAAIYLYGFATDQYVTTFQFALRHQTPVGAAASPSMATAAVSGGNSALAIMQDSEIVSQYIKSRQIVADISRNVDLDRVFATRDADWLARLNAGAPPEKKLLYWQHMVDPFFDMSTGITTVQVRAFTPGDSLKVASQTLGLSEKLINDLSTRSHNDAVAYANQQVKQSEERWKKASTDLAAYANKNAVLFPNLEANSDQNIEGKLRGTIAQLNAQYNAQLSQGMSVQSPFMQRLKSQIGGLDTELNKQASRMVNGSALKSSNQEDQQAEKPALASLLPGYNSLETEVTIASKQYELALSSLQKAEAEANEQLVYLDAFNRPQLAEESLYPVRWRIMLEVIIGSFLFWCLSTLLYHGVRDHID